ncbi:hypothetical protein C2G38_2181019 [Gigaspora rosea]|uniref:Syntaxin N-terminal domain-containing protein n=1 Tax=Gigaspora rosea TaxID=44941 RepID=A0A397VFI1_9GLOM|nr:hypothetical protein C2G38_2181019 [Gigaspora rosea]
MTMIIRHPGIIKFKQGLVKDTSGRLHILKRQRKLEYQKLSKDFQKTLTEFQKVQRLSQKDNGNKAKAHNVRNDAYKDDEVVIYETPLLINDNQRRLQFQALDNEVEYNESLIAEREGEIREIEQGFRNTSIRTTIDIALKVMCPSVSRLQKKTCNRMCCLAAVGGVVILL